MEGGDSNTEIELLTFEDADIGGVGEFDAARRDGNCFEDNRWQNLWRQETLGGVGPDPLMFRSWGLRRDQLIRILTSIVLGRMKDIDIAGV